ncbi:MAG: hypothetical protein WDM78_14005 [Puia sp.]
MSVSCAEGDEGMIYEGKVDFTLIETDLLDLPKITTPLMLNVGSPAMAFQYAHLPNAGVGLARQEFIINNHIRVHPMALLKHESLNDPELSLSINHLIRGFDSESDLFYTQTFFWYCADRIGILPKQSDRSLFRFQIK